MEEIKTRNTATQKWLLAQKKQSRLPPCTGGASEAVHCLGMGFLLVTANSIGKERNSWTYSLPMANANAPSC